MLPSFCPFSGGCDPSVPQLLISTLYKRVDSSTAMPMLIDVAELAGLAAEAALYGMYRKTRTHTLY